MTIKQFKVYKGSELTEDQIQQIAEDYVIVMKQMGEIIVGIDEVLDMTKQVIRRMENVTLLVNMLSRQRKLMGLDPFPYKDSII